MNLIFIELTVNIDDKKRHARIFVNQISSVVDYGVVGCMVYINSGQEFDVEETMDEVFEKMEEPEGIFIDEEDLGGEEEGD